MNQNDINLIRDARRGDVEAFARIVSNYKDYVYRTALNVVRNRHDAEDIAQEVFMKVFKSFKQLKDERTFPAWLSQIATRTALDWKKSRHRTETSELDSQTYRIEDPNSALTHAKLNLDQALASLSDEHRVVTILRAVHGFEYEEIAKILEIPVGTVKSRLHNARTQLRNYLNDEGGNHP